APLPAPGSPGLASYQIAVDVACGAAQGLTLTPTLPASFRALPSSVSMTVGGIDTAATLNPSTNAITPVAPLSCTGSKHVIASFQAEPATLMSTPLGSPAAQTSSVVAAT